MRWSEVRSRVRAEFADEIRDRVDIHFTRHHERSRCGRGWITIDGKEIAGFCDWAFYYPSSDHKPTRKETLAAYGELRGWDFKVACWSLLHEGMEVALASDNPMNQALAVLHRKFGKRRLKELLLKPELLHPLVLHVASFRTECLASHLTTQSRGTSVETLDSSELSSGASVPYLGC
jgi:hypothetical protein